MYTVVCSQYSEIAYFRSLIIDRQISTCISVASSISFSSVINQLNPGQDHVIHSPPSLKQSSLGKSRLQNFPLKYSLSFLSD